MLKVSAVIQGHSASSCFSGTMTTILCRISGTNRIAKEVGCKNMNGFGMMLFQGAAAFKLWTGVDMPIDHMKEVLGIRYGE